MTKTMPSLNLDVDQNTHSPIHSPKQHSPAPSGSSSPVRPTYSPITPVLGSTRLATPPPPASNPPQQPQRLYTHSQPTQTFISAPLPPPETISLDSNPDALALRSAISILQIQSRKATSDIQTLQQIKERAVADPAAFAEALTSGKIKTTPDPLFGAPISRGTSSDDESEDSNAEPRKDSNGDTTMSDSRTLIDSNGDTTMTDSHHAPNTQPWPHLPKPQSVVRTPPINWSQYGIVGESLDKLHADQVARPMEGSPARIGSDGQATPVEGGRRHEGLGVAAPYTPGRDKIEKPKKKR
jgi:hypothetical protein